MLALLLEVVGGVVGVERMMTMMLLNEQRVDLGVHQELLDGRQSSVKMEIMMMAVSYLID